MLFVPRSCGAGTLKNKQCFVGYRVGPKDMFNVFLKREEVDMGQISNGASFNLIDREWIPVVDLEGHRDTLSLRDTFRNAHRIASVAGELAQMSFSILRLQLAILYRVYSGKASGEQGSCALWETLWEKGRFQMDEIEEYLDAWRDAFDLFGDKPFFQTPGLAYAGKEADSPSAIIPDFPSKMDKFLFSQRAPQVDFELEYAEAARYLIVAQAYDLAGIKGGVVGNSHINKGKVYAPKGAVGTGWCGAIGGVFVEGENLFETILLNFVLWNERCSPGSLLTIEGDLPPWERDAPGADLQECSPMGPVDLLTWQSRRIRLVADEAKHRVTGVVLCYGDVISPLNQQKYEMMSSWRESKAQQQRLKLAAAPWMPLVHDPGKAIWRGLSPLLVYQDSLGGNKIDARPGVIQWLETLEEYGIVEDSRTFAIRIVGMSYGTQNSVYDDGVDDRMNLHALLLRHDSGATAECIDIAKRADEAVDELTKFVWRLEKASGDRRRFDSYSDNQANAYKNDVRERAYDELDGLFRAEISNFTPDENYAEYGEAWKTETRDRLWNLAMAYVQRSGASLFRESGDVVPGRSIQWLRYRLSDLLGNKAPSLGRERHEADE